MLLHVFVYLFCLSAEAGVLEAWPNYSSPSIASDDFEHHLNKLPLKGRNLTPNTGWSDDYWPSQKGSINRRWNAPGEPGFKLNSPSKQQVLNMSLKELEQLAPTEKYDLWLGRYSFPFVKQVSGSSNPRAVDWAGICNGWAPASLNLAEPKPVVMTNPDGIKIPFGASDIKAILSYYYAYYVEEPTRQIGLRCFLNRGLSGVARGCNKDLNPGALHIILANQMGILGKGLVADIDRYKEVWNQPVMGFESFIVNDQLSPSSSAAKGTVREVRVETHLHYVDETDPQWEPVLNSVHQKMDMMKLRYRLELNREGKIIGGEWESDSRPDFLWFREKAPFLAPFEELEILYQTATME